MATVVFNPSKTIRGFKPDEDYTVSSVESIAAGNPNSYQVVETPTTTKDLNYTTMTSTGGARTDAHISVTSQLDNPDVTYTSDTPTICSVDSLSGYVTALQTGVCGIAIKGRTGTRKVTTQVTTQGSGFIGYKDIGLYQPGSLRRYLYDQQVAAVTGVTPGPSTQSCFSDYNSYLSGINTNCFIRDQTRGASGFTPYNLTLLDSVLLSSNTCGAKAWISPHHYLTGCGKIHSSFGDNYSTIAVGRDSKVGYSATAWTGPLANVLPANWLTYLPIPPGGTSYNNNWLIYPSAFGSGVEAFVRATNIHTPDDASINGWVQPVTIWMDSKVYPVGDIRRDYQKFTANIPYMVTGGDSGSPIFCNINGTFVILSFLATRGFMGTDNFAAIIPEIETAMNALSTTRGDPAAGTYTVPKVDLSGFTQY